MVLEDPRRSFFINTVAASYSKEPSFFDSIWSDKSVGNFLEDSNCAVLLVRKDGSKLHLSNKVYYFNFPSTV